MSDTQPNHLEQLKLAEERDQEWLKNVYRGDQERDLTPRAIIATLNQEVARVLKQPELQKRLRTFDLEATHSTPEEFARRITREISMWSQVARNAGISIE